MTGASLVINLLADVSPAGVLPLAYGMSGTGRAAQTVSSNSKVCCLGQASASMKWFVISEGKSCLYLSFPFWK